MWGKRPVIVFPDAELLCIEYLRSVLSDEITVGNRIPNPRPVPLIICWRSGGISTTDVSDGPIVDIACWDVSDYAAMHLAIRARAYLTAMQGRVINDVPVYEVTDFSGPMNIPDPESGSSRVQFSVQISMRGS